MSYTARRVAQLDTCRLRGLDFQLYRWPGEDPDPVVLLHGWGDSAETWQFVVDELSPRRTLIAFDARGFGRTAWPDDGYWFPDYLADLEAILNFVAPGHPVDVVGHSMGGNVAMIYAGVRPDRIRRLINLEGVGLTPTSADQAPARYRQWLDEVAAGSRFATYETFEQFESVLARRNPRTSPDRLAFIARSWARTRNDGRIELRSDPRHKRINPVLYQRDQAEACWNAITAPTLLVMGEQSEFAERLRPEIAGEKIGALLRHARLATIEEAGHMMHHERPAAVAELIETFFR